MLVLQLETIGPCKRSSVIFEAMGLAFALPTAWLTELLSELEMRKLSLASVLPLSAAIYFGVKVKVGAWPSIVLAREHFRHVAYVFSPAGMLGYDAEANIGNPEQSAHRLGGRITAQYGVCRRRSTWTAHAEAQAIENPMLLGFGKFGRQPDDQAQSIPPPCWPSPMVDLSIRAHAHYAFSLGV